MRMIITPGQLARRADLYYQLARLTAAGFGLMQALETQVQAPPSSGLRPALSQVLNHLKQGKTLAGAVRLLPRCFPEFEMAILHAAEESGRLPECFLLLANHYRDKAALARQFLGLVAYPVLLLHVAVLVFPITSLQGLVLGGEWLGFFAQKTLFLIPLYALALLVLFLAQAQRGGVWRATLESFLRVVPGFGTARRDLALARLSAALEALLNAGVPIVQAWDIAAPASGSPALVRAVHAFKPHLEAHDTPAEAMQRSRAFPTLFANHYASGELSGKLDESLRWLHAYYQDEGARKLRGAIIAAGTLVFFLIAVLVAWQVVSFYVGYFRQIQELIPP